jgi:hypothetical protein
MRVHTLSARTLLAAALLATVAACRVSTSVSPAELPTELASRAVLARAPMRDTAGVAAVRGGVEVVGLLNQTAPCFRLSSDATRAGERIVVRLTATEKAETCNTFAAGAFDYDVGVSGLAPGSYDVEVVHRVQLKDGRVAEEKVSARRVEVK